MKGRVDLIVKYVNEFFEKKIEDLERVLDLYRAGYSYRDIADMCGIECKEDKGLGEAVVYGLITGVKGREGLIYEAYRKGSEFYDDFLVQGFSDANEERRFLEMKGRKKEMYFERNQEDKKMHSVLKGLKSKGYINWNASLEIEDDERSYTLLPLIQYVYSLSLQEEFRNKKGVDTAKMIRFLYKTEGIKMVPNNLKSALSRYRGYLKDAKK